MLLLALLASSDAEAMPEGPQYHAMVKAFCNSVTHVCSVWPWQAHVH